MNDYLDLYISYLAVEKGLSANTQGAGILGAGDLTRVNHFLRNTHKTNPLDTL